MCNLEVQYISYVMSGMLKPVSWNVCMYICMYVCVYVIYVLVLGDIKINLSVLVNNILSRYTGI